MLDGHYANFILFAEPNLILYVTEFPSRYSNPENWQHVGSFRSH